MMLGGEGPTSTRQANMQLACWKSLMGSGYTDIIFRHMTRKLGSCRWQRKNIFSVKLRSRDLGKIVLLEEK